jgi:pilus assembly protein CpaE
MESEGGPILRSIAICPDRSLAGQLNTALTALPIAVVRSLEHYPAEEELVRLLRSLAPQVVLLSVENLSEAVAVARCVETNAPGGGGAGLGPGPESRSAAGDDARGVREFLQAPFDGPAVVEAVSRAGQAVERAPRSANLSDQIFSFLPSKAGAGTSTVALNLGAAMSELPSTRVLLIDFDLNSGLIGFMLKLDNPHSVTDAAESSLRMDETLWNQIVSVRGALEVLPAGKINPGYRVEPLHVRSLLDFARRHYNAICLDLSGNLEKYSVEIMHESKRIFLVCTAELPSLHLAREKLAFLRSVDLEDRVSIVLNRVGKRDVVSTLEVEKLLGLPVYTTFSNDYKGIYQALASGKPVEPASELGKQFRKQAEILLSKESRPVGGVRKFVEYFSLLPARYSLLPDHKNPSA